MTISTRLNGFTPVIDAVVEDVGLMAAIIYGLVWRHCQMSEGVCRKSAENMAEMTDIHERTVRRHLKALCDAGYIEDMTPDVRGKPHVYRTTAKLKMTGVIEPEVTPAQPRTESPDLESVEAQPRTLDPEPTPDLESVEAQPRTLDPVTPDFRSGDPGQRVRQPRTLDPVRIQEDTNTRERERAHDAREGPVPAPSLSQEQSHQEKTAAAIAAFEKYHGRLHPSDIAQRETIADLVRSEGKRFSLKRFAEEARRLAAKGQKRRLDLVVQDYLKGGGAGPPGSAGRYVPPGITPEKLAALQVMQQESQQRDNDQQAAMDQAISRLAQSMKFNQPN